MLLQKSIGHVEDFLKLAVPRDQMLRFVEHGDAIAHVLERDAEFFLALPDLLQQPCILHRDHRLVSETAKQRDLSIAEWPHLLTKDGDHPEKLIVLAQCNAQQCAPAAKLGQRSRRWRVGRGILVHISDVLDVNDIVASKHPRGQRTWVRSAIGRAVAAKLSVSLGHATECDRSEPIPIWKHQRAGRGVA